MRFKKSFRKMLAAAIAAGTFAGMPLASAEVKEYEGFGEYVMSDFETPDIAKQRAKARAEQNAMEQAGVYVESYTKVINHQVTHDEIATMTNGILKVKDVQYGKMTPTEDGKGILICVTIKADIDTDDINKWLSQNKENVNDLIEQNKRLQKAREEQDRKIEELQKQVASVKTAQEKKRTQTMVDDADREFLSNQKTEEGIRLRATGDSIGALVALSTAVDLNPQNANAYAEMGSINSGWGLLHKSKEECARGISAYTKAIMIDSQNAKLYYRRSLTYNTMCDYAKQLADCTKAIELEPQNEKWYCARAWAYQSLENYTRAIEDCVRAIKLNPQYADAYLQRGQIYHDIGDDKRAIDDFHKTIDLNRNNNREDPEPYMWRSLSYENVGDTFMAEFTSAIAKKLIEKELEK